MKLNNCWLGPKESDQIKNEFNKRMKYSVAAGIDF